MRVSGIVYPGGFRGNWPGGTIAAGGSQSVTVTFSPTFSINYGGTVTVNSNKTSGINTTSALGTGSAARRMAQAAVVGAYNGLVGDGRINGGKASDMAAFFAGNGFLSLTTAADGSFSASLRLEGSALSLRGNFDASGEAAVVVPRTGKSDAAVALKFDPASPGKITGTVTVDGIPLVFTALAGDIVGPHPLAGKRHTVILPAPDATLGHGYATLLVAADGTATFAGRLADGTAFTTTSRTLDDGNGNWLVPVHIPLYTSFKGMLTGEIVLPKVEPSNSADVLGSLEWLRPADASATMFPDGFLKELVPLGERDPLQKNISRLSGDATTAEFKLVVDPSGALLPAAVAQAGMWPKSNVPLLTAPVASGLKLTFTGASGVFKGTFVRTVNGKSVSTPYEGAILASPLILPGESSPVCGGGFFSTGTASGPVEIE